MKEIVEFIDELKSKARFPVISRYFFHDNDSIYFRYGYSHSAGGTAITISNITIDEEHQGEGRFSRYLTAVEEYAKAEGCAVSLESVVNPFLPEVLIRKGYTMPKEAFGNFVKKFDKE